MAGTKFRGTIADFAEPVDFNKNEIRNAAVQNLAAAPSSPANGQIYVDTAQGNKLYLRVGAGWEKVHSGTTVAGDYGAGSIVNADISASAAIAYSKLNLATSIVNADIAAAAAIAYSKLALTNSIVNADIAAAAAIAYSKLNLAASIVNADINAAAAIAHSKVASPTADYSWGGFKLTNLADPIAGTDAANKQYVDTMAGGLDAKTSVRLATAAPLAANTRTGNVLTASANGALGTIDGTAPALNDRVLVKDEVTGANNGLFTVTDLGSVGTPWTMTRAADADTSAEVTAGLYTFVEDGATNADTAFVLSTNNPITLNTTALTFTIYSRAESLLAGAGLLKTGSTFDVVATGSGLTINANDIALSTALQNTHTLIVGATAGIVAHTAANTVANRTLTGTANRITITQGDGAAGNPTFDVGSNVYVVGGTDVAIADGGTGASTAAAARQGLGAVGFYSSATHGAGTTITITQGTHGLIAGPELQVQVVEVSTGDVVIPDININQANGTVTITFGASQGANSMRVTITGRS